MTTIAFPPLFLKLATLFLLPLSFVIVATVVVRGERDAGTVRGYLAPALFYMGPAFSSLAMGYVVLIETSASDSVWVFLILALNFLTYMLVDSVSRVHHKRYSDSLVERQRLVDSSLEAIRAVEKTRNRALFWGAGVNTLFGLLPLTIYMLFYAYGIFPAAERLQRKAQVIGKVDSVGAVGRHGRQQSQAPQLGNVRRIRQSSASNHRKQVSR